MKKILSTSIGVISFGAISPMIVSCSSNKLSTEDYIYNEIDKLTKVEINEKGKEVYASDVNVDNVHDYVDGLPSPIMANNVQTSILNVEKIKEGTIEISVQFQKKDNSNKVIAIEKIYSVDGFKLDWSKFSEEAKKTSFSKLIGKDEIFTRNDLINQNQFAFGDRNLDADRYNQAEYVNDGLLEGLNFMFSDIRERSLIFKKHQDWVFRSQKVTNGVWYEILFGKSLDEIKAESTLFRNLESVEIEFKFNSPTYEGDYNKVSNRPYASYLLQYNVIFNLSGEEQNQYYVEDLWNGKNIKFLLCCNLQESSKVNEGDFVKLSDVNQWYDQNSNANWEEMIQSSNKNN